MSTQIETDTGIETGHGADVRPEAGDHERFAHYVLKDKIVESAVTGTPVIALCGKVWVPNRDPKKFPVCPQCKELYEMGPEARTRFFAERAGEPG